MLGERRVCSLAYADNVVLLAKDERGMRSIMERLEEYLDRKGLELNVHLHENENENSKI